MFFGGPSRHTDVRAAQSVDVADPAAAIAQIGGTLQRVGGTDARCRRRQGRQLRLMIEFGKGSRAFCLTSIRATKLLSASR